MIARAVTSSTLSGALSSRNMRQRAGKNERGGHLINKDTTLKYLVKLNKN